MCVCLFAYVRSLLEKLAGRLIPVFVGMGQYAVHVEMGQGPLRPPAAGVPRRSFTAPGRAGMSNGRGFSIFPACMLFLFVGSALLV